MGEDPWKEVGPDSTYAVNGFDLLFIFVLVMMLGIKFNMRIMFKLRKLQFRKKCNLRECFLLLPLWHFLCVNIKILCIIHFV